MTSSGQIMLHTVPLKRTMLMLMESSKDGIFFLEFNCPAYLFGFSEIFISKDNALIFQPELALSFKTSAPKAA